MRADDEFLLEAVSSLQGEASLNERLYGELGRFENKNTLTDLCFFHEVIFKAVTSRWCFSGSKGA
ncbi:hypothetical protein MAR_014909 [Mya arenaria]|uniref:Uncharacterized protein n=1 Tax=Mya arenaria TaxID=6604 RepID=A0ABY7FFJ2_MYAAR|nr:hypothetical protein MAR_014909 [Mya arenaria]